MKKHPITAFFVLALLISWAGWIPYAASEAGILDFNIPSELTWLAEFGPTFSAIIVTLLFYGKTEVKNLLNGLLQWNVKIYWYLFAIIITPVLILLSIGFDGLIFGTTYNFSLLNNWDTNFIKRTEAFTPSMGIITSLVDYMKTGTIETGLVFLVLALTNGGLSEEIGWRGFTLKEFQSRPYNILWSSLFVALLWALWHTGALFWQTVITSTLMEGFTFAISYLLQYLLLVFPLSIMYTVLFNGTRGSILLSILLHAFYNISISVFATALPNFPMLTFVVILWLFSAILLLTLWKNGRYNKTKIHAKINNV